MGYRSLKRVLGETNLERKCRYFFGVCLLLLIFGSFMWVDSIAENLVRETTLRKARDYVDLHILSSHWLSWETEQQKKEFLEDVRQDMLYHTIREYKAETLALSRNTNPLVGGFGKPKLPIDEREKQILLDLQEAQEKQLAENASKFESALGRSMAEPDESDQGLGKKFVMPRETTPVFRLRAVSSNELRQFYAQNVLGQSPPGPMQGASGAQGRVDEDFDDQPVYWYYQAVYWKKSCTRCHGASNPRHAFSMAEGADLMGSNEPTFRAVKIIMPSGETQAAITKSRAILLTVGIVTVLAAMVALYVIVRYVVVKPLSHLRDVSDAISRGNTEVRADIHTNDEFEDLASSFNRMLRHLTDAQVELRQVNTDLDAKVDQLAQLNMRLYEMNRLKGDFLANMSHELRTPLNSIIGFSEVLQGIDALNDKQRRYAQNIQKSGRLLLEMINDILDLAKLEAGKMDVRHSEFRIETVVQAHCDMVRSLTEEKNIDLEVHVAPDMPPLFQDQSKVQQILTNLLSNAIKFTPEGGRITVIAAPNVERDHCPVPAVSGLARDMAARGPKGQGPNLPALRLTVADTGVGIAEEDREVIFEKFRQGAVVLGEDGFSREYSGTGLGLSIVKELCKLLGGEIGFESELGKGSEFTVTLPWMGPHPSRSNDELQRKLEELNRQPREEVLESY